MQIKRTDDPMNEAILCRTGLSHMPLASVATQSVFQYTSLEEYLMATAFSILGGEMHTTCCCSKPDAQMAPPAPHPFADVRRESENVPLALTYAAIQFSSGV